MGGYVDETGSHGYLLRNGTVTNVEVPGAQFTIPTGINSAGQIVGQYTDADGTHGFVYDHGAFTTIDAPGSDRLTVVSGIDSRGRIVGSYYGQALVHGFVLDKGEYTVVDYPGGTSTNLYAINPAGQIVGGGIATVSSRAFSGRKAHTRLSMFHSARRPLRPASTLVARSWDLTSIQSKRQVWRARCGGICCGSDASADRREIPGELVGDRPHRRRLLVVMLTPRLATSPPWRALRAPTMTPVRPGVCSSTPTQSCGTLSPPLAATARISSTACRCR